MIEQGNRRSDKPNQEGISIGNGPEAIKGAMSQEAGADLGSLKQGPETHQASIVRQARAEIAAHIVVDSLQNELSVLGVSKDSKEARQLITDVWQKVRDFLISEGRPAAAPQNDISDSVSEKLGKAPEDARILVGRSREADILVPSLTVSRRQAEILVREDGYLVSKPKEASAPVFYLEQGGSWQELTSRAVYLERGDQIKFGKGSDPITFTFPAREPVKTAV